VWFFNDVLSYDVMFQYVRELIEKLPAAYSNDIKFDCLTGLRAAESVASVHLIKNDDSFKV
jgi:hypothetical protein